MTIKKFADFNKTQEDQQMNENGNVAVVDMRDEAKKHIKEADENLRMAADAVYELKRMADYVKIDFPELSKTLGSHAETILGDIEKIQEDVKKTLTIIK